MHCIMASHTCNDLCCLMSCTCHILLWFPASYSSQLGTLSRGPDSHPNNMQQCKEAAACELCIEPCLFNFLLDSSSAIGLDAKVYRILALKSADSDASSFPCSKL
ncbi:hypothetical protein ABBQ32_001156 [Trebouxia sp. C0010 RCD-2024]